MKELYSRLMEFTGDAAYRYAYDDGTILMANRGLARVLDLDLPPGELVGRRLRDVLVYTEQEGSLRKAIDRAGEVHGLEYHFRTLSGKERWVLHDSFVVKDPATGRKVVEAVARDITERKLAERALAEERERLSVTLLSIGDGVIATDTQGRVTLLNRAAETLTGWRQEEAIGRPVREVFVIVNEKTREQCDDPVEKVLRTGLVVGLANHTLLLARGGAERCIADSGAPIRAAAGGVIGTVLVFRDVTERKRAAESLEESERRFRELADLLPQFVFELDLQGRFTFVSQVAHAITGYTPDDLRAGLRSTDVIVEADRERARRNMQRLLEGEKHGPNEYTAVRKDGSTFPVLINASAIVRDGAPAGFRGIVTDITERKRAEAALAAEKERLAVTLKSIGDGVISTDVDGCVVLMNREAESLTGWRSEEAIGRPVDAVCPLVDEATGEKRASPVREAIGSGTAVDASAGTVLVSRGGRRRIVAASGAPIFTTESRITGAVLVFSDVTEKQRAAEELARSAKLESIGILAGGIAHDFNNILLGVIGNVSLARLLVLQESEVHRLLAEAEKAALQARNLTQQLMTFARGGKPVKKRLAVTGLLRDSAGLALRGSNIACTYAFDEGVKPIEADEGQIGQVVTNLVINAKQAMPGGGSITIAASNRKVGERSGLPVKPGDYVAITIADTGIGIPPEHLERIFDPYFSTKQEGSGLGLATARSVVKRHDGCIEVASALGKGTSFTIHLPACEGTPEEEPAPRVMDRERFRILVMDDQEIVRQAVKRLIEHLGHEVEVTCEGGEAVAAVARARSQGRPFDAVILDLTVPAGMGGIEARDRIREIDRGARLIVSSGYSVDSVMSDYRAHGFDGVIMKPYRTNELGDVLARVVKGEG